MITLFAMENAFQRLAEHGQEHAMLLVQFRWPQTRSAAASARPHRAALRKLPVAHTSEPAVNLRQPRVPWSKRRPVTERSGPRLRRLKGPHCIVRARRAMIAPVRKHAVQSSHARRAAASFTRMAVKQEQSEHVQLVPQARLAPLANIKHVATEC